MNAVPGDNTEGAMCGHCQKPLGECRSYVMVKDLMHVVVGEKVEDAMTAVGIFMRCFAVTVSLKQHVPGARDDQEAALWLVADCFAWHQEELDRQKQAGYYND